MYAMLLFHLRVILGPFLVGFATLNMQLENDVRVLEDFLAGATRKLSIA